MIAVGVARPSASGHVTTTTVIANSIAWEKEVSCEEPGDERQEPPDERHQDEPERGPIGQALARSLGVLRLLYQLDDLGEGGVGTDVLRSHPQRAVLVDGATDHLGPDRLEDRETLAGDGGLIDLALAVFDDAVHRDLGARLDQDQVTDDDLGRRDLHRLAVAKDHRHRRREIQEPTDGVVGTPPRSHLEPVAQEHEADEDGDRLVEDVATAGERDDERIRPAGSDGHGHQDHHVEGAPAKSLIGAVEEDPPRVEDDRQAEQQPDDIVAQSEGRGNREPQHVSADP